LKNLATGQTTYFDAPPGSGARVLQAATPAVGWVVGVNVNTQGTNVTAADAAASLNSGVSQALAGLAASLSSTYNVTSPIAVASVVGPASASASIVPPPAAAASSSSNNNYAVVVGASVGGVIGGLILIAIIAAIVIVVVNRRAAKKKREERRASITNVIGMASSQPARGGGMLPAVPADGSGPEHVNVAFGPGATEDATRRPSDPPVIEGPGRASPDAPPAVAPASWTLTPGIQQAQ
jgi:hypothetical protein